jgi:4-aminobutyrate aminotransferase / (S)-3-amino-2-methylpropionate transaminase / 5-aminovalerate transaminase
MGYEFQKNPVNVPKVRTQFRNIQTAIPAPGTAEIFDKLSRYESRSMHGQIPIVWDRAEDFSVWDHAGNRWIDFTSTIFVANAGHANHRVTQAVIDVLKHDLVHTYTYASRLRAEYLEYLIKHTPAQFEKAFLLSAGTEATECAVKLMHMNAQKRGKRRAVVLSFEGAMHGRTLAAAHMGGSPAGRAWIACECPNFSRLGYPYFWELEEKGISGAEQFAKDVETLKARGLDPKQDIAGMMVESYVGWGAVFLPKDYAQAMAKWCKENDILLCFDEIQAGFGRTGKLFAYQHYDVEPDMICVGKGISTGLPLAAVMGPTSIMDIPDVGSMSSTHSANPISCAAGLATFQEIVERKIVEGAERKGALLHAELEKLRQRFPDRIKRVIGRGMVAAVIVVDPETGAPDADLGNWTCEIAMQKGLILVHTNRESIKIGPPLTISDEALVEGVEVLGEALAQAIGG